MRLRPKVLLIVGGLLATLFLVVFIFLSALILRDFASLERDLAEKTIESTLQVFDRNIQEIAVKISDWSVWDDMYRFAQDGNQEFIDSNLAPESVANLNIHLIAVFSLQSEIIAFQKVGDQSGDTLVSSLTELVRAHPELLPKTDPKEAIQGLVMLPEGPFLYAAHAVTTSDGLGQPSGTVVFGRFIDEEFAQSVGEVIGLEAHFDTIEEAIAEGEYVSGLDGERSVLVLPKNDDLLTGFGRIDDWSGKPSILVHVDIPRDVYHGGQKAVAVFAGVLLSISAAFILLIFFLLESLILRRITRLDTAVANVGTLRDIATRLPVEGTDEFAQLSQEINKMLASLEQSQKDREKSASQLQLVEELTSVMIWMSGPDHRATYFNKGWNDFVGAEMDASLGDGWSQYVHPDDIDSVRAKTARATAKGEVFQLEYRLRRHDGVYRWILVNGRPYYVQGKYQGYIGTGIDITERKAKEEHGRSDLEDAERMNQIMVARELKMIELKKKIRELEDRLSGGFSGPGEEKK